MNNELNAKSKVFVALSGGVDSSTSAALLLQDGFECDGIFMITHDNALQAQSDAEKVAAQLGIKLHLLDVRKDFEQIIDYFLKEYKRGRTPNPCVVCNRHIKFGRLWDFARANGADLLATGHYARIYDAGLYETANPLKDQSYVLSMINRDVLKRVVLPMGDYSKQQTRKMAGQLGLHTADKSESQEICFIPDDDYAALLEAKCPELVRKGKIVDVSGRILGEHSGIHRFTIGQRRGLKVAMGRPYYVIKIDAGTNTVTLGTKEEKMHGSLTASGVNWLIDTPQSPFKAKVKIRYNDRGTGATVYPQAGRAKVEFDQPVSAITAGQLAVFYIQDQYGSRVAGGGWIE